MESMAVTIVEFQEQVTRATSTVWTIEFATSFKSSNRWFRTLGGNLVLGTLAVTLDLD